MLASIFGSKGDAAVAPSWVKDLKKAGLFSEDSHSKNKGLPVAQCGVSLGFLKSVIQSSLGHKDATVQQFVKAMTGSRGDR